ncbi:hypothetical protein, partial [Streptomyces sp. MA15]|uniref:hypothetical protein n=1 Tax=Streptomyces sp. MA15 TaxID=3055061 RepID=UPI0025AF4148
DLGAAGSQLSTAPVEDSPSPDLPALGVIGWARWFLAGRAPPRRVRGGWIRQPLTPRPSSHSWSVEEELSA